ncbi:MAG: hypothetical protein GYB33_11595 [Gammaproteobacteria bacterium]|uniref:hypothetical protein n=1 Tax=Pseudomaricurvus alcaniphilus TaxID=1166482 RepID=UPI0014072F5B|nr:hypothetical protein [Pseudomaricurvus alcaniphilus]MBR9910979.1 hypothetical protein [Gammaproteobacteria bacterium]NHN37689.1 hypothetical protein [Pseudomaricurvus alcaniphilus]
MNTSVAWHISGLIPALILTLSALPVHAADEPVVNASYLSAIESLEREYGPYHNDLAQHLTSLGSNYQASGQYTEAEDAYSRAMHLNRISEGLYSLSQVPILERLIETNIAAQDWERASENHQYLYWLHRRNYSDDDPRMLPMLNKLSKWHLNAFVQGVDDSMFQHLVSAHNLFSAAASIIANSYGASDLRIVDALRGLTVSNYYLAAYQSYAKPTSGFEASFGSNASREEDHFKMEQYVIRSFSGGKNALSQIQQVYAENPDSPEGAYLKAKIELADWHLLFNRSQTAMELYKQTIAESAHGQQTEAIVNDLFREPVELPDLSAVELQQRKGGDNEEFVVVRFDVSPYGNANNIEIIEAYPENKVSNRSKVRKSLKVAKFRPRFENGVAVATENVTRRYIFSE